MKGLMFWAQGTVVAFGGAGLFLVAFVDSSFLSLPVSVDVLVVWFVARNEGALLYYVGLATLGSLAGCLALYWLTRKGGEVFLRKRFAPRRVERGMAVFRRYGLLAVLVPAILPPPTPFKLFILLAGVSGVSPLKFGVAITIGRLIRFGTVALLAVWLGDEAVDYISAHALTAGLVLVGSVLLGTLIYLAWRRTRLGDAHAL